jgi:hypothetical protein
LYVVLSVTKMAPGNLEFSIKESLSRTDANPLPISTRVDDVSSDTNARAGQIVLADSSDGDITITLPDNPTGLSVTIKKVSGSGNTVNVATPNDETIDGQNSLSITNEYTSREIVSNGDNYFIK